MTRIYDQPWNKGKRVGARRALSIGEIQRVSNHLKQTNLHDYCLFRVAIDTMLRASDLLSLKVEDVVSSNHVVKTYFIKKQKKTGNAVSAVLTDSTRQVLEDWVGFSRKRFADYLFTREKKSHDEPITIGFYRTLIKTWVEAVDIPSEDISAHSLRRSKPCHLYENGVAVELIGRLLGHTSPISTIRYLGIEESQAQEAALVHDVFDPTNISKLSKKPKIAPREVNLLGSQIWKFIEPKLDEFLKSKHSRD